MRKRKYQFKMFGGLSVTTSSVSADETQDKTVTQSINCTAFLFDL